MEYSIQLANVTKKIGNDTLVDDLTLHVKKGEVFGLLGPNGAGKTTTIRMIVGLMSLTSGVITIQNNSIQTNKTSAVENLGAIVEDPDFYPFMNGYQNLKYFARLQKNKVTKEKINEVINIVDLNEDMYKKVKAYSLGMKQRLGLAQCLLNDPTILILDEPTNGLDPAGIREIRRYIRKIASEQKITVLVSSHLLSEIELMCDRVGIIQKGKLIKIEDLKTDSEEVDDNYKIITSDDATALQLIQMHFPEAKAVNIDSFIHLQANPTKIAHVNKMLVTRDFLVYTIEKASHSLEDTFLELTRGERVKYG